MCLYLKCTFKIYIRGAVKKNKAWVRGQSEGGAVLYGIVKASMGSGQLTRNPNEERASVQISGRVFWA